MINMHAKLNTLDFSIATIYKGTLAVYWENVGMGEHDTRISCDEVRPHSNLLPCKRVLVMSTHVILCDSLKTERS